jgi:AraC-type transcriptional regulator N-terminus
MHLSRITELSSRYYVDKKNEKKGMPHLSVFCWDAPSRIEALIYEPALCLILQGSKTASIGEQVANLGPGDVLILSHDLPLVSRITKASKREPYLAVVLSLDVQVLHSLYDQVANTLVPVASSRSLSVGPVEAGWLEHRWSDTLN